MLESKILTGPKTLLRFDGWEYGPPSRKQKADNLPTYHRKYRMLKISLEGLQVLDAIDRRGSIAAASTELHRVPSTISYAVAKLEEDLDVAVFERSGPRLSLTPAGKELLKEGRYLLKAAQDLEHRVRRVASGWETQLTIGLESLLAPSVLTEDIRDFYQVADSTRLRITQDALSGSWEALLDRRVDLIIGAAGEGPSGGGFIAQPLGSVPFVFAVAPEHPLASAREPLDKAELRAHRAVAAADSALRLAPRTVGLLFGQDTLTVPDIFSKYAFQLAGLGFGYLPEPYARAAIEAGRLIKKRVAEPRPKETFYVVWRPEEEGAALTWWLERIRRPGRLNAMFDLTAKAYFKTAR
jgi:DNA-binding transcriptional LysR family regulator